jgi:hypothetical protein
MVDTRTTLQIARDENSNTERRLTDNNIVWYIDELAVLALANAPYREEVLTGARNMATQANDALSMYGCLPRVNVTNTLDQAEWRAQQLPFVAASVIKLGRICSRLADEEKLTIERAEHSSQFWHLIAESLNLAALVGLVEPAINKPQHVPILLYKPLRELIGEMIQHPTLSPSDWRLLFHRTGRNAEMRKQAVEMHLATGRSLWCCCRALSK